MNLDHHCQPIELILTDVDGVLTDGGVILDNRGIEVKRFHIHDGLGIKLWRRAGGHMGIITARNSHIVEVRAAELGVDLVRQGVTDKLTVVRSLLDELHLRPEQACYIGDDLPDLQSMALVGLGAATANACQELKAAAKYVTQNSGGHGAVREVIELILKAQRRWADVIRPYQP